MIDPMSACAVLDSRSDAREPRMDHARELYLDLLKRCLTNSIYGYAELDTLGPRGGARRQVWRMLSRVAGAAGFVLARRPGFDPQKRANGRDWPPFAHTMAGMRRLRNVQECIETVLRDNVPGDFIETGVWRGGVAIFMRGVLKAHGVASRKVWAADSFEGLPRPNPARYPADRGDTHYKKDALAVSLDEVRRNFAQYDLLDEQVEFLKGWFSETLPTAPIERLALLRLDGDMYESTMDALSSLYPKLSPGGFCIIDDYATIGKCKKAVDDYRQRHAISEPIRKIDEDAVFWRVDEVPSRP